MNKKLNDGILMPFEDIPPEKVIQAVPVISAINVVKANAKASGYTFRVPKESPVTLRMHRLHWKVEF